MEKPTIPSADVGDQDMIELNETRHELVNEPPQRFHIGIADTEAPGKPASIVLQNAAAGNVSRVLNANVEEAPDAVRVLSEMVRESEVDLGRYPSSVNVAVSHAAGLLQAGRLGEADIQLQDVIQRSGSVRAHVLRSHVLIARGMFEAATVEARAALGIDPKDLSALRALAEAAMRRGDFAQARATWMRLARLDRQSAVGPFQLGVLTLAEMGSHASAIAHLKEAIRRRPRWAQAEQALGVAYVLSHNMARARRHFEIALALAPGMSDATQGLAHVLRQLGDVHGAVSVLEKGVKSNPNDPALREMLAWIFFEDGRLDLAQGHLVGAMEQLTRTDGDPDDMARIANNLGVSLIRSRDWARAEIALTASLRLNTQSSQFARNNLGLLLIERKRPQDARSILADGVSDRTATDDTYLLLARISYEEHAYAEAIEILEEARLHRDVGPSVFSTLGFIMTDATHRFDEAVVVLTDGHTAFPADVLVSNNLAYALLMLDDVERAREVLSTVAGQSGSIEPRFSAVLQATNGLLKLKEGDLQAGESLYLSAEATASTGDLPDMARAIRQKAHLEVARALLKVGRFQEAMARTQAGIALRGRQSFRDDLVALQQQLVQLVPSNSARTRS
jgi:Flp pilus assembly protein TadD